LLTRQTYRTGRSQACEKKIFALQRNWTNPKIGKESGGCLHGKKRTKTHSKDWGKKIDPREGGLSVGRVRAKRTDFVGAQPHSSSLEWAGSKIKKESRGWQIGS